MDRHSLLDLLASGEFRSGQELADSLGVSRTAVWKQVQKLEELGLQIESVKGKGYCVAGGVDLLSSAAIRKGLSKKANALLSELIIADSLDSTNSELMRRLETGAGTGLVCCAEQQLAGRGRRGRQWVSPFAGNIYLSLAWEYAQGVAALEGLSLATGVAVIEALRSLEIPNSNGLRLKWPNDILAPAPTGQGWQKLGGILIEIAGDSTGNCHAVLGVGLNIQMSDTAGAAIDQPWTTLSGVTDGPVPPRSTLVTALVNHLLPLLAEFEDSGFAPWRDRWVDLDAYAGAEVTVSAGTQSDSGISRGVDQRGALLLDTADGEIAFYGGEVSLRGSR